MKQLATGTNPAHFTPEAWTHSCVWCNISIWASVVNVAHPRCDQLRKGSFAPLALHQKINLRVRGIAIGRDAISIWALMEFSEVEQEQEVRSRTVRRVSLGRQNPRRNANAFWRMLERDVDGAGPHRTTSIRRSGTFIFLPASFAPVGAVSLRVSSLHFCAVK